MWEFFKFVGNCILEGWEAGDHVFAVIEGVCFVIGAGMLWLEKKHKLHKTWRKFEDWIMMGAFGVMILVFIGSSLFYVPFLHHKKLSDDNAQLTAASKSLANDLKSTQADLDRMKRLNEIDEKEQERKRLATLEESARQRDRMILAAATNVSPLRAVVSSVADGPVTKPSFAPGKRFDLSASETAFTDLERQNEAKAALAAMNTTESDLTTLRSSAPVFDYFITRLRSALSDLAESRRDHVFSDYTGMPPYITNGFQITAGLKTNAAWNFRMFFAGPGAMHIRCGAVSATIDAGGGGFDARFDIGKGTIWSTSGPISSYHTNLDELVSHMIVVQNRQSPLTNATPK
jgi:hypothetical protein